MNALYQVFENEMSIKLLRSETEKSFLFKVPALNKIMKHAKCSHLFIYVSRSYPCLYVWMEVIFRQGEEPFRTEHILVDDHYIFVKNSASYIFFEYINTWICWCAFLL